MSVYDKSYISSLRLQFLTFWTSLELLNCAFTQLIHDETYALTVHKLYLMVWVYLIA